MCLRVDTGGESSQQQVPSPRYDARLPPAQVGVPSSSNTAEHDEVNNAATILEFLAWGRRKEVSYVTQLSPCVERSTTCFDDEGSGHNAQTTANVPDDDSYKGNFSLHVLQLLLPERALVVRLVDYHIDCLLWYHGSFYGSSFRSQLAEFYNRCNGNVMSSEIDLQWVALLFAILAGSISCGNKATVQQWGFHEAEQELLSRKWLHAVVSCLNSANYMAKPSILSCEAIATLTISAHLLGCSNQQSVLLASAVRIAQSLGLHQLDETSPVSVARETGRRLWAQLCSQDWFSIPFAECYLINPLYSETLPAMNCNEDTLEELPASIPTVTSYCRYLHSIAALMPQLQDGIAATKTMFTKYEQVMKYDKKMRSLASEQRPTFLCNVPIDPSWPRWTKWARSAAAISSSHKIIMIHRKFLSMSFTNPAFAFTRKTCIAASKTILKEAPRLASEEGPVLWIFHAFTVAAGITLCLDALHREASDAACAEHCVFVEEAVDLLQNAHNSKIASRGARILADLLLLEKTSRASRRTGSNNGKRKAEEDHARGSQSKRQHSIDMRDIVRDLQRGVSPVQVRGEEPPTNHRSATVQQPLEQGDQTQQTNTETIPTFEDNDFSGFLAAEEALANFHSSYMSHDGDAFGNLLSLAQTYTYT